MDFYVGEVHITQEKIHNKKFRAVPPEPFYTLRYFKETKPCMNNRQRREFLAQETERILKELEKE